MEIRTDRLLIRSTRPGDVDALVERRSDPEVARYQSFTTPYPRERAEAIVVDSIEMGEPKSDEWYMLTVASADDSEIYGDLALRPTWGGRSMEIGYTFASSHWGRGYASEAVGALVDRLFSDEALTRISAMLHPDNHASAMVIERNGFAFEGRTALSYWVGDDNTDDLLYGLTRAHWREWKDRPQKPPSRIELVEVAAGNHKRLRECRTHHSQERFVAPVMASLTEVAYPPLENAAPLVPWVRAIEADGVLAGMVMVSEMTTAHPEVYLWRLLIDRRHQRRGIGRRVVEQVIAKAREDGSEVLMVSWVEGKGSPRPLYEGLGFVPTGEIEDGETVARLELT